MEEVSTILQLKFIEAHNKVQMLNRLFSQNLNSLRIHLLMIHAYGSIGRTMCMVDIQ